MVDYKTAYQQSLEWFEGDVLAAEVYLKKYALTTSEGDVLEPTPAHMFKRLAKEFARIEKKYPNPMSEQEILECFDKFQRIIPGGSVLTAVGNKTQKISASNCCAIESPTDDIGGIFDTAKTIAQLTKRRMGIGVCLDTLRPEGMIVNNAAKTTSGAWSFASLYSNVLETIGQNGRRAALLLCLSVHHPDVEKFITMKQDLKKVTKANISILLTDEFMNAVINDREYEQRWPLKGVAKVSRQVKARNVWKTLTNSAWKTAEPGCLYIDTIKKNLPADFYPEFETISPNACCFAASQNVWVVTKQGIKELKTITKNDLIWIDAEKCWAKTSGYFFTGVEEVFNVKLSNGEILRITKNHKLRTIKSVREGTKLVHKPSLLIPLNKLKVGDKVLSHINEVNDCEFGSLGTKEEGMLLGWMTGDGCLSFVDDHMNYPTMILDFWAGEFDVAEKLCKTINDIGYKLVLSTNKDNFKKRIKCETFVRDFVNKYEFNIWKFKSNDRYNEFLFKASKEFIVGYLSSYFSADGTVHCDIKAKQYSVQLASISKIRLEQIKQVLLLFGIKSSIGLMRAAGVSEFKNGGKYSTKDCWRLTITGKENLTKYNENIGFINNCKQSLLNKILEQPVSLTNKCKNFVTIMSIDIGSTEETGCIEIENHHQFTANGIISGNSEIPLSKNDACRLFALNLTNYVDKPFEDSSSFNQEEFKRDIHIAMKLIDDLVDIELEQIKDIMDVCEEGHEKELWKKLCSSGVNGRRTGLGCLGLADCLAQLNLVYGSPEGIDKIDEIYKTLRDVAYETSIQLGKERGTFPVFDWNKEKDCEFIKRLPINIQKQNKEFGRRNISILTQAPTGTIALLAKTGKQFNTFGVSSGMEPVFRNAYIRRRKINAEDNKSKVDFVDTNGERWQEYEVSHSNVQNYVEKFGKAKQLPKYFITSDEIDWAQRVKVQSVITSYLDHSCSSTINLPKGTSEDVIEKVYLESWKQQNKGVTVYVDGCRDGVLITSSTKTKQPNTRLSLPRPKELPCDIFHTTVQGEKWTIFVGVLNGKPYEAIGGLSSKISMPKRVKSGKILKHNGAENPVARYDLHYDYETDPEDETIIRDIANIFDNKTHAAFTRMISLSLRHEIPIRFLVEQLEKGADKDDEDIYGFSRVMGRVLKKYIKDGEKSAKTCPNCHQETLIYREGCVGCSCGWSKC